jgi:hypothetical protein
LKVGRNYGYRDNAIAPHCPRADGIVVAPAGPRTKATILQHRWKRIAAEKNSKEPDFSILYCFRFCNIPL